MSTYKLTLAYRGTDFSGFARQKDPAIRTVQEELEQALAIALRLDTPPHTVCAGRTDAGVHACAQVVSFSLDVALSTEQCIQMVRSLNALTARDISVSDLRQAPDGFSARFDAISRKYHYRIFNQSYPPIFAADYVWHLAQSFDIAEMQTAANYLLGEHDFRSFCTSATAEVIDNTMRTVTGIEIVEEVHLGESVLAIKVTGNAFLHSMVRIIVGTLVEVGTGKRSSADIPTILAACDRTVAGQTAPAHGLTLYKVEYPF
ncbi:MAG: tRNA pseudouridine(38-40) synthase TruA [Coriobacteriia bacterium]|nr:tRNA pseudouridine(38-40) synthase TruA [Coriobacteriia bacterium]